MLVPRIGSEFDEATVRTALWKSVQRLGYESPTEDQVSAVTLILRGLDVFVSIPTGSGKSLCYACLPYVYSYLRRIVEPDTDDCRSIVVVIEPLISIMEDQVQKYGERGLKAAYIGKDQKDETSIILINGLTEKAGLRA